MRSHVSGHVALAASVLAGLVIAACGGGGGEGPGPQVPATPSGPASPPTPPSTGTAPPASSGSGSAATPATHPPIGPMKAIVPSAMAEDLKKLGIDPLKPPPLNKLSPDVIRKVMGTFRKALGVKCDFCHDANDFKAWTPNKHVAENMWQHYIVDLRMQDGSPLYCDSCHNGSAQFLDRGDKKALSKWMDANYVSNLKRADKKDHSCDTCHGDPFEPKIVAGWAK